VGGARKSASAARLESENHSNTKKAGWMMALFRYPGRKTWWYDFRFAGQVVRESARTRSKEIARRAEQARRRELEEGYHGLKRRAEPRLFSVAATEWLTLKKPSLAPKSYRIEQPNLQLHLLPIFGRLLVTDIDAKDVAAYQQHRLTEKASPKTINLEVGTLRAILRRFRVWANVQPDVRMLPSSDSVGRALSDVEERALLTACGQSRSTSLMPVVALAINTCLRYSEIRLLRWNQVDLTNRTVTVGKSKTESGTGRVVPLNGYAGGLLDFWAGRFPTRRADDFVFPSERYGAGGDAFAPRTYHTDPTKPIGDWKEAWEYAKKRAGVKCRFHDLRHTGCTRMLEAGAPFATVAVIMGWSPSATVLMARRYGHIGQTAQRQAVTAINTTTFDAGACAFPFDVTRTGGNPVAN
jgi:integrase